MLVPDNQLNPPKHVVSMFLATGGAGGHLLGSDEKEIIYLVFGIIDLQNKEIIGIKQYLVRPLGIQFVKSSATSPNTSATSSESGSIASTSAYTEPLIPDAILQSAGRSLGDAINDFDSYLRSLKIDQNNICLVTDGQLPLRQCLHPEAGAKEIPLPSYYWKFSDLKKEFVHSKSGDLSRALISINDVSKLPNMPALPQTPSSIADILNDMELKPYLDNDFYIKESRDMITVVQSLIIAGHSFESNEIVNLTLEPGICSIDDEIDGNCIVRARGLPWQSSDQDIAKFFRGLNVAKGGVALCLSPQGRRNGEALIRFISQEHRDMALKRHKHHIGSRYIEVYRASGEDFLAVAGGASNEAQTFLSKGAQVIIRMRGLPYDCTANQVLEFFANGDNSCKVLDDSEGILFVKKPDGRSTGDAFVLFAEEVDAPVALSKHRESIGQRYIELFRSTIAEVQQVLNRSMDPKTYEQNAPKPPLIAQIPPAISQMPMLPQHVITSGTEKNCIRLRGLPYEAKVEHILHFLEDFAKHIVYQGVHLVYNAQGQFNGEAFIQMDSESAAQASAQQKHHKHMLFGKKQRYIEVFQCSGEDMNLVLNGGGYQYPSPNAITAKPLASSGNTLIGPPPPTNFAAASYNQYGPPTPPLRAAPTIYPQPPQILYWGYPNGPMSPTTAYFGPLQIPHHAFTHFTPDRPTLLAVGDPGSPMEDIVDMQPPKATSEPPNVQYTNNAALPNQLKLTTNFNFHIDDQGRMDVSKALCYQSQEIGNNVITKKVLVMKKAPMMMTSPTLEQQQHYVDCNNNNMNPPIASVIEHMPPPHIYPQKHYAPHPLSPLNINTQFHATPFVNHLNWSHPQYQ